MVEFCPKCGKMLMPKKESDEVVLVCRSCGYTKRGGAEGYRVSQEKTSREETIIIREDKGQEKVLPTIKVECPKCGHNEAYWWLVQTRRADEGSTRFFRCVKCGYTWREYD
ncbi:MAG: transcription factor S [Candidatus Methanomethylicota archaeon]|uniref:Transcription factor S n=1 Tax=Thermoproteota archaeon TaxID=2056631 RepID=A0A497F2C8_9CREN|nr:MAG: transcription factor S [Candidatus Verstraetearchaeota archaeon]RLE53556.1 MAG: transcription factor S [Candidatus Verstraetearchaeota archaeon]